MEEKKIIYKNKRNKEERKDGRTERGGRQWETDRRTAELLVIPIIILLLLLSPPPPPHRDPPPTVSSSSFCLLLSAPSLSLSLFLSFSLLASSSSSLRRI